MCKNEIALQLTLAALNNNKDIISFKNNLLDNDEKIKEQNAFNVKQIIDFYNTIISTLSD